MKLKKTVMAHSCDRLLICTKWLCLLVFIYFSCRERKDLIDQPTYEGPSVSMDSVLTKMSDSGHFVVILKAPKQLNFENGNKEWPEGLYLENIGDNNKVVSTFKADYVSYSSKERVYHSKGNVVVKSLENGDELNTDELFWNPSKEEFYTERFVTIQSEGEVHTGEGLTADQDFSTYSILKPQGTLVLDE